MRFSANIASLVPSATLAISARAKQMKAAGESVIDLSAGEPSFGTPDVAMRAAREFVDSGQSGYPPTPGLPDLRAAVASYVNETTSDASVDPANVIITSGCSEALALSLQTVTRRGDIVAVESPTYFSVLRLIERMGLLAVEIDSDPETGLCLDALENAIETMDIKAVVAVLNFSNPVGSLMPDADKERLVGMLEQADIPLIEDDIHGDLHFGEQRPAIAKCYDRKGMVLTCSSFSKTIAPGYRIGWVIADRYRNDVVELKHATSSAMCSLPQMAMADYLRSDRSVVAVYIDGHTDDVGSATSNIRLARQRAEALADFFTNAGVDPELIKVRSSSSIVSVVFGSTFLTPKTTLWAIRSPREPSFFSFSSRLR